MSLRYGFYRAVRTLLPPALVQGIAGSNLLRPLRDAVLRPGGEVAIVRGNVRWEDLSFSFAAPPVVLHRAQTRGIENRLCRLARAVLSEGNVAVDVGGNYGFVTAVLAHAVGVTGHVITFEIEADIATVLHSNVRANGLDARVKVVARGAGAPGADGFVTVDDCLGDSKVKFLMVDTDGNDLDVLRGSACVLRRDHPVVVVEMHENEREIFELLEDAGYTYFMGMSNEKIVPGNWPPNMIASVNSVTIPGVPNYANL